MIQQLSISYMQMRKNMAAIIKFVHAIILFISLLFVVTQAFRKHFFLIYYTTTSQILLVILYTQYFIPF
jgi:hypothetical protein